MQVYIMSQSDSDHVDDVPNARRTSRNRNTRGVTVKRELAQDRMAGERRTVQYNSMGQDIGESSTKLHSYIGMCVRAQIPITYEDWYVVPDALKELI